MRTDRNEYHSFICVPMEGPYRAAKARKGHGSHMVQAVAVVAATVAVFACMAHLLGSI